MRINDEILSVTNAAPVALTRSKLSIESGARAARATVEILNAPGDDANVVFRFTDDPAISPVVGNLLPVRVAGQRSVITIEGYDDMAAVQFQCTGAVTARLQVTYFS